MTNRIWDCFIGTVALAAFALLLAEHTAFGDAHQAFFVAANLVVLVIFALDVVIGFVLSKDKRAHLRGHWFSVVVFVPLIQFVPGIRGLHFFVIVRQVVIVLVLISRSRHAGRLLALLSLRPAQLMIVSFVFAIGIGAVLLMLPGAVVDGSRTALVDAVFTATSAVCVTGLIVQDTAVYFSRFGQAVILLLIQAGGLGIMTFSVALAVVMGRQMDVRRRAAMQDILDYDTLAGVRRLVLFIVGMTFVVETCGWLALTIAWRGRFESEWLTAWHALFHAVSAFCNAGFSTFSDSLTGFAGSLGTNAVIVALIVVGGLGFMVIKDLIDLVNGRGDVRVRRLRVQTKVVLVVSGSLIVAGGLVFYALERYGLFAGMGRGQAGLMALFQSVTSRTAGFNSCDIAGLSAGALLVTMALMFVGASPGSTGGGIKTTTVAALLATILSEFRQRDCAELHRRTIPYEVVRKAVTLLCLSLILVLGFAVLLMYVEEKPFVAVLFETVSAFGTVGLSTGLTPQLSTEGKLLVTVLMLVGRLGPLTFAYAFASRHLASRYEYAEERLMIG